MRRLGIPWVVALSMPAWLSGCEEKETPREPKAPAYTQVAPTASRQALATQEKIVKVEARKQVEIEKINAETRLKQLELEKERELALLRERERLLRLEHEQAKERYVIWAGIAAMILAGLALLWYFDRRRQDKLIAYRDNLQKYFLFKENETRLKIAEKIIDAVAKQEIDAEEKAKLIEVLHSPIAEGKPRLPEEPELSVQNTAEDRGDSGALEAKRVSEEVIDVEEESSEPSGTQEESGEPKRPWYRFW
jgi:hypothetical protein